jgi:hypothetical protein
MPQILLFVYDYFAPPGEIIIDERREVLLSYRNG